MASHPFMMCCPTPTEWQLSNRMDMLEERIQMLDGGTKIRGRKLEVASGPAAPPTDIELMQQHKME